jgi:hypothetical protein
MSIPVCIVVPQLIVTLVLPTIPDDMSGHSLMMVAAVVMVFLHILSGAAVAGGRAVRGLFAVR